MEAQGWARVADKVNERIAELDLSGSEVARLSGVNLTTLRQIRTNLRPTGAYAPKTLRQLAKALRWTPDSLTRIAEGGDPTESSSESAVGIALSSNAIDSTDLSPEQIGYLRGLADAYRAQNR